MGNCMVVEEDVDGKIIEYTSPILVHPQGEKESQTMRKKQEEEEEERSDDGNGTRGGVVRIKLVISRKELQELLLSNKDGGVSLSDMVSKIQGRQHRLDRVGLEKEEDEEDHHHQGRSWKPVLESIPEMDF